MKLSMIIPVFNEKKTLGELIRRVMAVSLPGVKKEIIIVDDKSTDSSRKVLGQIKKQSPQFKILYHQRNQGKGAAVRTGLKNATGDYVLIQDADLEYDPQDISRLLKPIQEGKAEVVYGSRFTGEHRNMFFWHMIGNKLLSFLTNLLYNTTLSDMEVCYKLFPRQLITTGELQENRWGFDPEITAKILRKGVRIYEVPISYAGREVQEGKKIAWQDGFRVFWALLRYRL
ncbi:glycosyl transferase [Candidatus Shapirobacteria bacterium CG10_big_fil_rev_8_21_14_0_10_48_15]|uniref:Glycosyl transferase n=1 Tax=Candidatus Shapirobacteria bacterium CG10_big_fil_rev_8_21_14_0_10_48_15 TaxID=1974484 RepID=A0A2M8L706_9BACT|nr:MAG: glycosyl transferase [Candidatus Shapirobacteria bacterium CG10_big_fil_rev_8_21_14_0_10_48_15]